MLTTKGKLLLQKLVGGVKRVECITTWKFQEAEECNGLEWELVECLWFTQPEIFLLLACDRMLANPWCTVETLKLRGLGLDLAMTLTAGPWAHCDPAQAPHL